MTVLLQRIFPTPTRSLLLFVVWLLLNNSVAAVHLVAALLLATLIPLLTAGFRDPQPRIKKTGLAVVYVLRVLLDVVVANLQVIRLVLGPNQRLKPGFVLIPLQLTESLPLTILAGTVSLTPGTVSAEILPYEHELTALVTQRFLLVHVLDLQDEAALIQSIQQRYEAPLLEMF